jgi:hypothetical protein
VADRAALQAADEDGKFEAEHYACDYDDEDGMVASMLAYTPRAVEWRTGGKGVGSVGAAVVAGSTGPTTTSEGASGGSSGGGESAAGESAAGESAVGDDGLPAALDYMTFTDVELEQMRRCVTIITR